MRGIRARQVRREAIPPDLLADAKRQIRAAATERRRRTDAIHMDYRKAERELAAIRERGLADAYAECEAITAEIMRDATALAELRHGVKAA